MKNLKERKEQRENNKIDKNELKTFLQEYYEHAPKMTIGEDSAFRSELIRWKDKLGITVETLNAMFKDIQE